MPIWHAFTLGSIQDRAKIMEGMEHIGSHANSVIRRQSFTISPPGTRAALVRVTEEQLGLSGGAPRERIYARAGELGLRLCPPDVIPEVAKSCRSESGLIEVCFIATEPLPDDWDQPNILSVDLGRDFAAITAWDGKPDAVLSSGFWVFVRSE